MNTQSKEIILRFEEVSFGFGHNKPILDEVTFSLRRGTKITLMGQNGSGKSTIFGLITKAHKPEAGKIHIINGLTIAIAKQVIPRTDLELTVREFFEKGFDKKMYDIDPRIDEVLEIVNLSAPYDRQVKTFFLRVRLFKSQTCFCLMSQQITLIKPELII